GRLLLSALARGTIGGAVGGAAGTPPPTAPPLSKGRTRNVAVLEIQHKLLNGQVVRGTIGGAIASGAAGTPPPTAPPLGKGRMGNVAVLEFCRWAHFARAHRQNGLD
ncbi:MAG: hypothetical protein AAGC93_31080, partial [Cyanobacteria bacterium P01_F01_bin.53]